MKSVSIFFKRNNIQKTLLFVFAFTLIVSCQKDDDDNNSMVIEQMTVEKDGENFVITDFTNKLTKESYDGMVITQLSMTVNLDEDYLNLSVFNLDWQNPPKDGVLIKTYDTATGDVNGPNTQCKGEGTEEYCDQGIGTFSTTNNVFYTTAFAGVDIPGEITILKNNIQNRTVTGSFYFTLTTPVNDEMIEFKGEFENLKYVIE